jgi:hypothetical protein
VQKAAEETGKNLRQGIQFLATSTIVIKKRRRKMRETILTARTMILSNRIFSNGIEKLKTIDSAKLTMRSRKGTVTVTLHAVAMIDSAKLTMRSPKGTVTATLHAVAMFAEHPRGNLAAQKSTRGKMWEKNDLAKTHQTDMVVITQSHL